MNKLHDANDALEAAVLNDSATLDQLRSLIDDVINLLPPRFKRARRTLSDVRNDWLNDDDLEDAYDAIIEATQDIMATN